jgi:MFS family permease
MVGFIDALLNSVGIQRLTRTALCAAVGLVGGIIGGLLGQALANIGMPLFFGWIIVGVFVGASIGVFDILAALKSKGDMKVPLKRTLNGVYGGLLGGFTGGLLFQLLNSLGSPEDPWAPPLPVSKLAIGLVILGLLIGLLIALAQVFLKEAWVKIESGRRAGKEMMLSKDQTSIGRAEGVDIGLYGEQGIEKLHARIVLKNNRYYLEDNETPGGTFLNDHRIDGRAALKHGDRIQVGSATLRFGEREKRRSA